MEIAYSLSITLQSHQPLVIATIITLLSLLLAVRSFFKRPQKSNASGPATSAGTEKAKEATSSSSCNSSFSCNGTSHSAAFLNGGSAGPADGMVTANVAKVVAERQSGASMMEQLVPEITTHALSYLDYPSLCRLSMTNSLMRKAANDDNAWKALYHKVLNFPNFCCLWFSSLFFSGVLLEYWFSWILCLILVVFAIKGNRLK